MKTGHGSKPNLYLIPGLGGDARLFEGLRREGLEFEVLEFIPAVKKETLSQYSQRLACAIDTSRPFVIGGVSLGGIISVEIAKVLRPQHVVLISAIKNSKEMPPYIKLMRMAPVYRLLSGEFLRKNAPKHSRKKLEPWQASTLQLMRDAVDPAFVRWAVHAVVQWRSRETPEDILHLQGTHDLLFPHWFLGKHRSVRSGSHVMVLSHAREIAEEIRKIIG